MKRVRNQMVIRIGVRDRLEAATRLLEGLDIVQQVEPPEENPELGLRVTLIAGDHDISQCNGVRASRDRIFRA